MDVSNSRLFSDPLRGLSVSPCSLQAGSSVENVARSKYKGLVTSHEALIFRPRAIFNGRGYFERATFSTQEPACRLSHHVIHVQHDPVVCMLNCSQF